MRLTLYFPVILVALGVSFTLSPFAIGLVRRIGLIDQPGSSKHKQHTSPMPMAGGLIILVTLFFCALIFGWNSNKDILGILVGMSVIFVFGALDDWKGFGAKQKMLGQFLGSIVLIVTGTQVHLFVFDITNLLLTTLWVIGVINAFNFVDSMDGLALGLAGIASGFLLLVTIEADQPTLASLSAGILGVCIGSAFFNLPPAKMFLGDSGSQSLGFLMAAIGMAYNPVGLERLSSWYVPILLLGVPIFDTALVVFSRIKRGAKIYQASHDHTYHRLCRLGLEPTRAVFAMHLMGMILGFVSFIALDVVVPWGNVIFAAAVLVGLIIIIIFEKRVPVE
ncbi:MAG: MraY family glycosyltransferase [Anaerolineales bacterium]